MLSHRFVSFQSLFRASVGLWCGWFASLATAADWPHWRGPLRNSISSEAITPIWGPDGPPTAWTAQVGTGFSSLVIAEGRVITMGNKDEQDAVVCLSETDGQVLWTHQYAEPLDPNLYEGGPNATPTIAGASVFTLSRRGHACCLDAASGKVRWEKNVQTELGVNVPSWGFSGSPLVIDNKVLLNVGSSGVLLDGATGEVLWKSDDSDDAGYSTPVILPKSEPASALLMSGKAISAVNILDGSLIWKFDWITRYGVNAADPQLVPAGILLSSGYSKGATLLTLNGSEVAAAWRSRELRNQMSPGVVLGEALYAVDGDAGGEPTLRCLNTATGELHWSQEGLGSASLIAAGSTLLILSDKGELVVAKANPQQFEQLAAAKVLDGKCWTIPALANGRFYARNASGKVVCVELK